MKAKSWILFVKGSGVKNLKKASVHGQDLHFSFWLTKRISVKKVLFHLNDYLKKGKILIAKCGKFTIFALPVWAFLLFLKPIAVDCIDLVDGVGGK